jgi:hypothetical protein
MFRLVLNYLLRSFRRNAFYQIINISGLVIALTSVYYILIWINQEISYDDFHPSTDRVYRFTGEFRRGDHQSHFSRTREIGIRKVNGANSIRMLTTSYQSLSAASRNPVDSLRNEYLYLSRLPLSPLEKSRCNNCHQGLG